MGKEHAQLSLEYLLLLLAVLGVFAFILPLLSSVYRLGLFGLDSANAESFAARVGETVSEMRFLANGSSKAIEAKPFTQWTVSCTGRLFTVSVTGASPRQRKEFSAEFPNALHSRESTFQGKKVFLVRKSGNRVSVEYN